MLTLRKPARGQRVAVCAREVCSTRRRAGRSKPVQLRGRTGAAGGAHAGTAHWGGNARHPGPLFARVNTPTQPACN